MNMLSSVTRLGAALAIVVMASAAGGQAAAPKTDFTGDLGFVSATGNTRLTTLSVGEKLTHTNGRWVLSQLAAYVYGKTNAVESANQLRLGARADFAFRPRFGGFGGRRSSETGMPASIPAPTSSSGCAGLRSSRRWTR